MADNQRKSWVSHRQDQDRERSHATARGVSFLSLKWKPESSLAKMSSSVLSYDVVLLYPKTGLDLGGHTVAPPHSILSVAAPIHRSGYKVKIIDMRRDEMWREALRKSISRDTICIGISVMTGTQIHFALIMAAEARRLTDGRIPLVWGGHHPTILPEQTLKNEYVDIVVFGEGEITFHELVNALGSRKSLKDIDGIGYKNGSEIVLNSPRKLLDVDNLLPVPWDLIDVEQYINPDNYFLKNSLRTLDIGQTSRGCPYRCGFCCSSSVLHKKWRPMSIEHSMERILEPVRKFNLTGIWIRDDEFYVDHSRAFTICRELINSGQSVSWYATGTRVNDFNKASDEELGLLKRSGAAIMKFGAESGNNRILDLIQKGFHIEDTIKANLRCKKHGILPAYSFMIAFPTETFKEINNTIDFAFKLKVDNPQAQLETFAQYTAFPCTPMYDMALAYGLNPPDHLAGWIDWILDDYDFNGNQIPWFNKNERRYIGNISYMSILAFAIGNIAGGITSRQWHYAFSRLLCAFQKYYAFRLKNKSYKWLPELMLARYMRKKFFYRSTRTIR